MEVRVPWRAFPIREGMLEIGRHHRHQVFANGRFNLDGVLAGALADNLLVAAAFLRTLISTSQAPCIGRRAAPADFPALALRTFERGQNMPVRRP